MRSHESGGSNEIILIELVDGIPQVIPITGDLNVRQSEVLICEAQTTVDGYYPWQSIITYGKELFDETDSLVPETGTFTFPYDASFVISCDLQRFCLTVPTFVNLYLNGRSVYDFECTGDTFVPEWKNMSIGFSNFKKGTQVQFYVDNGEVYLSDYPAIFKAYLWIKD